MKVDLDENINIAFISRYKFVIFYFISGEVYFILGNENILCVWF